MKKLKKYEHLYKLYKQRTIGYFIFSVIMTVLSVPLIIYCFVKYSYELPSAFGFSGFILAGDMFFWLPFLSKSGVVMAQFKKFNDEELARINTAFPNSEKMFDLFSVTEDAIISTCNGFTLIPVKNILWVYSKQTKIPQKMFGMLYTTRTVYQVVIAGNNKKLQILAALDVDANFVVEFLESKLSQYRKGIFYGYSKELKKTFKKDFKGMLAASEAADAEMKETQENTTNRTTEVHINEH